MLKFINDTNGLMWSARDFKIKSKADAEKFLTEIIKTEVYSFRILDDKEYTINKKESGWSVCERMLFDGMTLTEFDPTFEASTQLEDAVKLVYKYRKIINAYFFAEDR